MGGSKYTEVLVWLNRKLSSMQCQRQAGVDLTGTQQLSCVPQPWNVP